MRDTTIGVEVTLTDETDGAEYTEVHELPAKYEVCCRCDGRGKVDNPAFHNGISHSEWINDFDYEERGNYLAGHYDVTCDQCKGLRVQLVVDSEALSFDERKIYKQYIKERKEAAEFAAICAAERRMGA